MAATTTPRSWTALFVGALLSMVISGALVIATAKAGISPGVSPLVVLIGWVVFGRLMQGRLKPFLAILQVTGSGGAAVSAGLIFTAPITQIAAGLMGRPIPEVDVATTVMACLSGSLMGWGFVGLATKRFLTDPRLPAPEAVACHQLIQTAAQNPEERPPVMISLLPALVGAFVVRGLVFLNWLEEVAVSLRIPLPFSDRSSQVALPVPISPLFFGIGALLTLPTAILIFCGGVVNSVTKAVAGEYGLPEETYRWVGGAAMVMAVVYSLIHYALSGRRPTTSSVGTAATADLLELSATIRMALISSVGVGALLLIAMLCQMDLSWLQIAVLSTVALVLISFLSGLGGLLSLQVGSSASPVSGTVFMAMLVLSITGLSLSLSGYLAIETLHPVLVVACVAIATANDSSQDYKTVQLNGYQVSSVFFAQLVGCLVGAFTVPFSLWIAHDAFGLGTEQLPCPQASFFAMVLNSLFDPATNIPWIPVAAGGLLGLVAVAIEVVGRRRGMILSSLAFAVGIYLPAVMGVGILLGNLAKVFGARSWSKSSHRGILSAAGLIAGDSLLSLLAGVLIVVQLDPARWTASAPYSTAWSCLGIVLLLVFVGLSYGDARRTPATE